MRISRRVKSSGMEIIMSSQKNRRGKGRKNRNTGSSATRATQPAHAPLPAEHQESSVPADANENAADVTDISHSEAAPAGRFGPTMLFGEVDPFNGEGPTDPKDKLRQAILPLAGIIACLIIVLYFQARLAGFSPGSSMTPGFSKGSSKPAAESSEQVEETQENDNSEPAPAPDTNSSESPEKSTNTPVPEGDSSNNDQNNEDTAPEEESDQSEEDTEYTEEDSEEEYYEDEGDQEEEDYYEDENNYEEEGDQENYEEEFELRED